MNFYIQYISLHLLYRRQVTFFYCYKNERKWTITSKKKNLFLSFWKTEWETDEEISRCRRQMFVLSNILSKNKKISISYYPKCNRSKQILYSCLMGRPQLASMALRFFSQKIYFWISINVKKKVLSANYRCFIADFRSFPSSRSFTKL